jgi:FtsP/CotA-like multicopper oxidase with cupredoxin domain
MKTINRRELLALGGAALGGAALSRAFGSTNTFPQAPTLEIARQGNLVEANLISASTSLSINGKNAQLLTYNSSLPGSVLRVREGDTVRLKYTNKLPEPSNLHLHGLHISPKVDQPMLEVKNAGSHVYEFELPKGSSGTYWYHPHVHGNVAAQMAAGLVGAMIVSGPLDSMPELRDAEEKILVLKDLALVNGSPKEHDMMDWMNGQEGNLLLVNGALKPTLRAAKATLRLRIINASNARYYNLQLENHPLYLIATDGGFIEKPVALETLLLAPGERAEVLVRLTKEGSFKLQNLPYARGTMMMGGMSGMGRMSEMGRMSGSSGDAQTTTLMTVIAPSKPKPLPLPSSLMPVEKLDLSKAVVTRRIELSEQMMQAKFYLNKKSFDPNRIDFQGNVNTLEIWELHNKSDMDHPFHLHSYPFQIIDRNGKPESYRAWKDVVNLKKNDLVRIAVPLRDFVGLTVYHCHVVEHEDRGMMGTLEVRD